MKRGLVVMALAPLLWGCPKEQKAASVGWADGRLVFDGDRGDCIVRASVAAIEPDSERRPVWSLETPMPMDSESCPMRLPIVYGEPPAGVSTWPGDAPAPTLEPGRRYAFEADGGYADHGVEFAVPAR